RAHQGAKLIRGTDREPQPSVGALLNADWFGTEEDLDAVLRQDVGHFICDVRILSPQKRGSALDDGHRASETTEELPEFDADVATPEDEQALRHRRELHDARRVERLDILQAVEARSGWARTGVDEDPLSGEFSRAPV